MDGQFICAQCLKRMDGYSPSIDLVAEVDSLRSEVVRLLAENQGLKEAILACVTEDANR